MQNPSTSPTHELPLLGGIAAFIRWLEELVSLLAGPLLTVGLGIALVALLSDGALLVTLPVLVYVWSISLAIGVDFQLIASFDRARIALRERRYGSMIVLLILGCALAYTAWVAAYAFGVGQADHVSTAQALATLGMDDHTWLVQRFALQVFLVCLSGWERYHAPAKQQLSLEDELSAIDRKTKLAAANQQLREVQALGVAHLGRSLMAVAKGEQPQDGSRPETPPTGPGNPLVSAQPAPGDEPEADTEGVTTLPVRRPAVRQLKPAARASVEEKRRKLAFKMLAADPEMSALALQKALSCRWATADKLKREFDRQQSQRLAL